MYQTIVEAVMAHGKKIPEKTAIAFKGTEISYEELNRQIISCAAILSEKYGIGNRDRVMLSAVSKPEFVVVLLSLQYLGAITVPVDKAALEENITDVYYFNSARLLFTDTRINDEAVRKYSLSGLYEETLKLTDKKKCPAVKNYSLPATDEIAEMLFTTGTTGRPKGAMLSYGNVLAITKHNKAGVRMQEDDIILIPLPLNHSVGMRVLRTALYIGATVVIQNGFTFPKDLRINMDTYKCTGFVCVPAVIERLYRQMGEDFKRTFDRLRYMEIGAGSLSTDSKKKLVSVLPDTEIFNTWGSTETGGAIFLEVSRYPDKYASLGRPVEGVTMKVVDPEGREIVARDLESAGRLTVTGPMMMQGYYNLPEQTTATLKDGWLITNDLVYTDEEGFVYMLGRADDIINVGGEKVSPIEVENTASEYPRIIECACIGVPDPDGILGQIPVLYYASENGLDINQGEIRKFLLERMEAYKIPGQYLRIEELPRNRMKKLDRKKLHALYKDTMEAGKQEAKGKTEGDTGTKLDNQVITTILARQSIRDFTDQRIPREVLEKLIKCAIQAPTANNMQTWRFFVMTNKAEIAALKELIADHAKEEKVKFYGFNHPDALILLTNDRRNDNGSIDCALAAENITIAANSLGIGSVFNNALKSLCANPEIRKKLNTYGVPARHDVCCVLCLGYPANTPKKIARREDIIKWIE